MTTAFRRYHRYQIFAKAIVKAKYQSGKTMFESQVNNISQGGMGVYTDAPLMKSTPVFVELSFPPSDNAVEDTIIEGSVASLTEYDDRYFMGIVFDKVIPHENFMKIINLVY
jgi:c-di-GMP-binding flagellar brake protein YcgR